MGQRFSAPNGSNGGNINPGVPPTTTKKPDFSKCEDKIVLKQLLIDYINNLKYGSVITRNSRKINESLNDRIKFLEQEKKNININYTVKETDFKLKDKKVQQLQRIAKLMKYIFFILIIIMFFIILL